LPNHFLNSWRVPRSSEENHHRAVSQTKTPITASKTRRPVTLKHLAAVLAEEHQLTKKAGEALLGELVGSITKHLNKGQRIRIAGLGILQVKKRAARMGRNPANCGRPTGPKRVG
jgi:DNA-binding protein HU-beta